MKNLIDSLKGKGVKVLKKANKVIKDAKENINDTMLMDKLKRRFNLENPHKFIVTEEIAKTNLVKELSAQHAKRYDEDNIFVFFGNKEANEIKNGFIVKDLKTLQDFIVKDIVEVEVPVELDGKSYEVIGTAVYTEEV
ncbi:MAG: hypothetical protein K9L64_06320 [Candidatus Izimaplasma sp.]|nr:hypothetical protein [Candidatus Izimaplasma bacterium]